MPTVNNKARYISVAVTVEGEQSRTIPGSPPNPVMPPAADSEVWVVGSSCELMQWPLAATGNVAPTINIQGLATTLTGPEGSDFSFSFACAFAPNGDQYVFNFAFTDGEGDILYSVPIFASGVTGNVDPRAIIQGPSTLLNDRFGPAELSIGGICLDGSQNIYVGAKTSVLKFAAGSTGNVAPTIFIDNDSDLTNITSLFYDSARDWIWVSSFSPLIRAYDPSGALQREISWSGLFSPWQVGIGPDGSIFVSDSRSNHGFIYVFAADASGDVAPVRTITLDMVATSDEFVVGLAVINTGVTYVSYRDFNTNLSHVVSFAADASGTDPTPVTDISGDMTFLDQMLDMAGTQPQQLAVK